MCVGGMQIMATEITKTVSQFYSVSFEDKNAKKKTTPKNKTPVCPSGKDSPMGFLLLESLHATARKQNAVQLFVCSVRPLLSTV